MPLEKEGRASSLKCCKESVLVFQLPYVRSASVWFSTIKKLSFWKRQSLLSIHYVCISSNHCRFKKISTVHNYSKVSIWANELQLQLATYHCNDDNTWRTKDCCTGFFFLSEKKRILEHFQSYYDQEKQGAAFIHFLHMVWDFNAVISTCLMLMN